MKPAIRFPDPRLTDENGIVFVGGELSVENILNAYKSGIFPWPHKNLPLLWFSPIERGVMDLKKFKVPKSVVKEMRKKKFEISFDRKFAQVMENCGTQVRAGQPGTWITPAMKAAYHELFKLGHAHSVECWRGDELVGGLYGVFINGVFSGESMYFHESGASKACLIALADRLIRGGHEWFDIQMVTSVLELFGGEYWPREKYLNRLEKAQAAHRLW
jgi:leucyl/phenylalanyl-tRNA--protein transferase